MALGSPSTLALCANRFAWSGWFSRRYHSAAERAIGALDGLDSDAAAYIAQRPARAKWGVRTAMWDQRQTVDAQIMTLLAVDEVIRSANAMKP